MRAKNWKNDANEKALARAIKAGHVRVARNKHEFLSMRFNRRASIIVLPRKLRGDFKGLAKQAGSLASLVSGVWRIGVPAFPSLFASDFQGAAAIAARQVKRDILAIGTIGYPELRVLDENGYGDNKLTVNVPHIDGGKERYGRFLVTYCGPVTRNLLNRDLKDRFTKPKNIKTARNSAQPFSFGQGAFVRHACISDTKPNYHYAPKVAKHDLKLMLVS